MSIPEKFKNLPPQPGCYLFKNSAGAVIYIGKAKNLKKRVNAYQQPERLADKTKAMVKQIAGVDFMVTDNELEALLLEAQLIKKCQPKYNLKLKLGERYAYLKVTKEIFPRLVVVRKCKITDRVFGPHPSGEARQYALRLANSLFKLRVCKKLPQRPCLLWHIHQCTAPCLGKISQADYQKNLEKAVELLKGNTQELIRQLKAEMKLYAKSQQYELAKTRRDQIAALHYISERQKVQLKKTYDQDVINYINDGQYKYVQFFNINKGVISGRKEFKLKAADQLNNFVVQYYYTENIPQEIILPQPISEQKLVEQYLQKRAGRRVKITVPVKGDKLKLLELLKQNILVRLKVGDSALLELQNRLSLPTLPKVIECFDVSNLGENNLVGSMVQFSDGKPNKDNYRRFKIKTVSGQSDYDCLKEIIFRRYYRLKMENAKLPDLIVIDGGKPQLSAALAAQRELGLPIPAIALAKKLEEIYAVGRVPPLHLPRNSAGLKLLQRIRNEAHRFALKYHWLLRSKRISAEGK